MRSLAKTSLAAALSWSGMTARIGRRAPGVPLILGYHRVVDDLPDVGEPALPAMTVSRRMLRAHLEWVARRFRIVSLDELGAFLERGGACGNLAAVTFDDGYRDVHDHALPLLQQMGVPAAAFVVSSLVGTQEPPLHDQLYQLVSESLAAGRGMPSALNAVLQGRLKRRRPSPTIMEVVRELLVSLPAAELRAIVDETRAQGRHALPPSCLATLDWSALASMQRAGMLIGSHTRTHALLTGEDDGTVVQELERSRAEIETRLGTQVCHFAYPDGRFSRRVVRAVANAGYRFAYTICDHRDPELPLLTIPRVMLWEGSCTDVRGGFSPSLMRCHATSVLPFSSRCQSDHGDWSGVE